VDDMTRLTTAVTAEALRTRRFGQDGTSLADVGEGGLLHALVDEARRTLPSAGDAVVVAGGDDAAVWRPEPGHVLAVTQDAIVEGVDYRQEWTRPYLVGRRTLTISLSDLASMGAEPRWCVATCCAGVRVAFEDLLAIQHGICDVAAESGCAVIGGDVSRTDGPLMVDLVACGSALPGAVMRRDAGRPGDLLLVTGSLGRAAAGLRLLMAGDGSEAGASRRRWVNAQLDPVARVGEGIALARLGVACCGDLSDGLLVDTQRTAEASGCAAELWLGSIPADPGLRESFPEDWAALALAGGEDFELLAAVAEGQFAAIGRGWDPALAPLTVVGRLVEGQGLRLLDREDGTEIPAPAPSSRHF
jgi:thiamine-monophosphate kinase